jgi:hypothetical protein
MTKPKKKSTKPKQPIEQEQIRITADFLRLTPIQYKDLKNWTSTVPFLIELHAPEIVMNIGFSIEQLRNFSVEVLLACEKFEEHAKNLVSNILIKDMPKTDATQQYI